MFETNQLFRITPSKHGNPNLKYVCLLYPSAMETLHLYSWNSFYILPSNFSTSMRSNNGIHRFIKQFSNKTILYGNVLIYGTYSVFTL